MEKEESLLLQENMERVTRYLSENHVPIVAVSKEVRSPDVSAKASGDRLQIPGAQASGDWSEKTSLVNHPDSHNLVVEQAAVEPRGNTTDDMRVSSDEEPTDLPFIDDMSKHKQANWQAQIFARRRFFRWSKIAVDTM